MSVPNLKRVSVSSEQELAGWLARQPGAAGPVMLVTRARASHRNHVSREQVGRVLADHGWTAGPRYTLNGDLLGHVIVGPGLPARGAAASSPSGGAARQ